MKTHSTAAVEQHPPTGLMATAAAAAPLPPREPAAATSTAAATAAPSAPERKLRILCLHGYLQNAEVFRSRLGSMRKALKSRAEFIFIDGPHLAYHQPEPEDASELTEGGNSSSQGRSWW